MGITDTARDKAQAEVSKAQANVTSIQAELDKANDQLKASQAGGGLLDSVKDVKFVGDLTDGMRSQSGVDQDQAQAKVDQLTLDLSTAQNKLDMAEKAQNALQSVVGDDK